MDIALLLSCKYPDLEGWEVVNNKITKFPGEKPTQKQLEAWWREIEGDLRNKAISQEREARYRMETDGLLYDALAKMDAPELKEWKQAREAIKSELAYPSKEVVIKR